MPALYMLCGLPGSGKTTLARKLEVELPALRFSPDEWLEPFFGGRDYIHQLKAFEEQRAKIEALQLELALRSVTLGVNAILENGFWTRGERDIYRAQAAQHGLKVKLYFLHVSLDELWARLSKRNADLPPGTFHIDRHKLEEWSETFEPPSAEELS